jgi:hypothetical protein
MEVHPDLGVSDGIGSSVPALADLVTQSAVPLLLPDFGVLGVAVGNH